MSQLKGKKNGGKDLTFSRKTKLNYIVTKTFLFENLHITEIPKLLVLGQRENY